MNFVKHGTSDGANAYKSEDGRFYVYRHNGNWTATDGTRVDPCCPKYSLQVARGNTLAVCKARLAKYLTAESE